MINKIAKLVVLLCAVAVQMMSQAEDIDLFVTPPPSATVLPNVLLIVDNSANWNTVFTDEKNALKAVFDSLPEGKFNVGLMLFSETGGDNPAPSGGYVRAAIRTMDATNRPLYSAMIDSLDNSTDRGNGRSLSLAMAEAYRYFTGGAAYGGIKKKRDFLGNALTPASSNTANNAVYARPFNAFSSSSATTYTTPITNECQKNFIIYIGNSTASGNVADDNVSENETSGAMLAAAGGDTSQISISPVGASVNYSNEWTRFMRSSPQNIFTYTIDVSLGTGGNAAANTALLKSMAVEGGGKYFYADGNSATLGADIERALSTILSEIQSVNSVFASVSLPVSVNTQGTYLNQVYIGMFRPDTTHSPRWAGNLKQFKLGQVGSSLKLLDAASASAINNQTGFITECARSYWTPTTTDSYWSFLSWPAGTTFCIPPSGGAASLYKNSNFPDGNIVEKGAQAYMLRSGTGRNMKTCGATMSSCSALVAFDSSSASASSLGVTTSAEQTALIAWAKGDDTGDEDIDANLTEKRPSAHGDVVHSRPVAVNFGTDQVPQVVVFYGGNDGVLRAVNGNRANAIGSVAAGGEMWSFMPPEFYGSVKRLRDNLITVRYAIGAAATAQPKPYGMDGPITAFKGSIAGTEKAFVYAAMRRGGRSIYAFDVTNSLSAPTAPTLKWRIGCAGSSDADCTTGLTGIGQTWASLKSFTTAGYGSGTSPLVIFGGGYDTCEDHDASGANNNCTSSSKGGAIYVVDADTGTRVHTFDTGAARGVVADVTLVRDDAGQVTYGYTADLGGNVYRMTFAGASTAWTITKIASLGCSSTSSCPANRKFMFAPSVVALSDGGYGIMIGSGDREKPIAHFAAAASVQNHFFRFDDKPALASGTTTGTWPGNNDCGAAIICLASLWPITGSATPTAAQLATKKGWYLALASTEQVVTSAVTIFGVVTFSTHQPAPAVASTTTCGSNLGETRVYNINYENAASANGTNERYEDVAGDGLPPSPVAGQVTLDNGQTVPFCIGCSPDSPLEGKLPTPLSSVIQPKNRLYWYIQK